MKLRKASRRAVKLKIGFSGASGTGKTLSALRMAYGMIGNWDKIALIDTENGSGELYADKHFPDGQGGTFYIGSYQYINLTQFSPEKYIEAIHACEQEQIELIIIDSITHEWDHLLAVHSAMNGNSYANWAQVTPRHDRFKQKILQSPCHIFTTVRRKQEYEMQKDGDKTRVVKLGTKELTRDGWEYELTTNFEIGMDHRAKITKDRTALFVDQDPFIISEETGKSLLNWAQSETATDEELLAGAQVDISNASTVGELNFIYNRFNSLQSNNDFLGLLTDRKEALKASQTPAANQPVA